MSPGIVVLLIFGIWFCIDTPLGAYCRIQRQRRNHDVTIGEFWEHVGMGMMLGPFWYLIYLFQDLENDRFFNRIMIEKCPKRAAWKALGGERYD